MVSVRIPYRVYSPMLVLATVDASDGPDGG